MSARRLVLLAAVVLTGLSAGFFYTFEASVTPGLELVDDNTYVATFQALNEAIRNPAFAIVFFGTIPTVIGALVLHWRRDPVRRLLIAAALALYLGAVAVTATGNVPLNEDLADVGALDPLDAASAAEARQNFEADWNQLNLIRAAAIIAGFAALVAAAGIETGSPGDRNAARQRTDEAVTS